MKGRRSQVAKKYTASGRMRRGRPGQGGPLRDSAIAYSSIMAGFYESRTTNNEPPVMNPRYAQDSRRARHVVRPYDSDATAKHDALG